MGRSSSSHRRRRGRHKQLSLTFKTRGGARPGAGRKPKGEKAGVPHTTRPALPSRYPVHTTSHLVDGLPGLRKRKLWQKLRQVFFAMHERRGFRIVHYSVQRNHIHLVVEAKSKVALSRGMQSFKIRFANAVNEFLGRRNGTVFADRYHMHILRTPTETRAAIRYVILNGQRHGEDRGLPLPERWTDPYSSAPYFDGWRQQGLDGPPKGQACPAEPAGSWLLREGWLRGRGGKISILEIPGPWPSRRAGAR